MAEIDNDSKLVATFDVGGPISLQSEMDDVFTFDDDDGEMLDGSKQGLVASVNVDGEMNLEGDDYGNDDDQGNDQSDDQGGNQDDYQDDYQGDDQDDYQDDQQDDQQFDDFSDAAMAAEILNRTRPGMFNETPKDLKWEDLLQKVDEYVADTLHASKDALMSEISEKAEYVDFLLQGGNPQALQQALQGSEFSKLDLERATDEQKEEAVRSMLLHRNYTPEDAQELIETYKLKGLMDNKSQESQQFFKNREKSILQQAKENERKQQEDWKRYQAELRQNMTQLIDKKDLLGIRLNDADAEQLKSDLFTPTELVEVPDGRGGIVTRKLTRYQVAEEKYKQSLPQQLAFAKLLLDGFDFTKIKNMGKFERDNELIDKLNNRAGRPRRKPGTRNAYLE